MNSNILHLLSLEANEHANDTAVITNTVQTGITTSDYILRFQEHTDDYCHFTCLSASEKESTTLNLLYYLKDRLYANKDCVIFVAFAENVSFYESCIMENIAIHYLTLLILIGNYMYGNHFSILQRSGITDKNLEDMYVTVGPLFIRKIKQRILSGDFIVAIQTNDIEYTISHIKDINVDRLQPYTNIDLAYWRNAYDNSINGIRNEHAENGRQRWPN